jgi:hypothetical protein
VCAIDPGPTESAYVVWDGVDVVECGHFKNEELKEVLSVIDPDLHHFAIEMIASYGMAVGREVFETCVWIGRFIEAIGDAELVYRKDVKLHLCHSPKAKDANIRQALIDRFGAVGTKKNPGKMYGIKSHLWAALAIAVTVYDGRSK